MNIKIQGGGGGVYANAGSCTGVVNYLTHEDIPRSIDGWEQEPFFNQYGDNIGDKEVIKKIDNNRGQLHKTDSKFFVLTVSPSQEEIKAMGFTISEQAAQFRTYINEGVMNRYAENFGKGLTNADIMYYAKIHHTRGEKEGNQMHAHIIVSRKDMSNKIKLSPQTNHRGSGKGAVKSGFDRDTFFRTGEHTFDEQFAYDRDFKQSYDYLNTVKNGKFEDIKKIDALKKQHDQRIEQNKTEAEKQNKAITDDFAEKTKETKAEIKNTLKIEKNPLKNEQTKIAAPEPDRTRGMRR